MRSSNDCSKKDNHYGHYEKIIEVREPEDLREAEKNSEKIERRSCSPKYCEELEAILGLISTTALYYALGL
jgi:hypothetical protein